MGTVRSSTDAKLMSQRTLYVFTTTRTIHQYSSFPQAQQLESGDTSAMIMGVMIESNLVEGRQDIPVSGPSGLTYGQSVTGTLRHVSGVATGPNSFPDACISWEQTVPVLDRLREGVRGRRILLRNTSRVATKLNGANGVKVNGTVQPEPTKVNGAAA